MKNFTAHSSPTAAQNSRPIVYGRRPVLLGVVSLAMVVLLASACGTSAKVTTANHGNGPAASPPSTTPVVHTATRPNLVPGQPVAVADAADHTKWGYITWAAFNAPPGPGGVPQVFPVTNAAGKLVAYWAAGYGWIDVATVQAPGFSMAKLLQQRETSLKAQPAVRSLLAQMGSVDEQLQHKLGS